MKKILVTGGAGFIGSHTYVALKANGYEPIIIDDFSNSKKEVLIGLESLVGEVPICYEGNVASQELLERIFSAHTFYGVIHFAGYKAVGESVAHPMQYYRNNIESTLALIAVMEAHDCRNLIFSSSATVYGEPEYLPIDEEHPLSVSNPYGRTKLFQEEMLSDLSASDARWKITLLRYFNPVGAHPSGLIGEDPTDIPNNLFPVILKVISGELEELKVFGGDFPTVDGSGVRDYIHVVDLAQGHVAAVVALENLDGVCAINLGTGKGYSVLEVLRVFESALGRSIPHCMSARRPGDVAACYADPTYAERLLGWKAEQDLQTMVTDALRRV